MKNIPNRPQKIFLFPSSRLVSAVCEAMNWNIPQKKTRRATAKASRISGFSMNWFILLRRSEMVIPLEVTSYKPPCKINQLFHDRKALLTGLIPQVLESGNCWNSNGLTLLDTQSVTDKLNEAPDRHHHEEGNNTPEHDLLGICLRFLVALSEDVFDQAPEEGQKGDTDNDWQSDIDQSTDGTYKRLQVAQSLSRGKCRSKCQSGDNNFFHLCSNYYLLMANLNLYLNGIPYIIRQNLGSTTAVIPSSYGIIRLGTLGSEELTV